MFRKILVLAIACAGIAACNSATFLSEAQLDARILKETFEAKDIAEQCMAGDVGQCEAMVDKTEAVMTLIETACSRNEQSAGCQGKKPMEKLVKAAPLYLELAKGDLTAIKKLTAVLDDKPEPVFGDVEKAEAAAEAAAQAADVAQASQIVEQAVWDKTTVTPAFLTGTWVSEVAGQKNLSGCGRGEAITYHADGSYSLTGEVGQFTLKGDVLTESPGTSGTEGRRMLVVRDNDETMLVRESGGEPYRMFRCHA